MNPTTMQQDIEAFYHLADKSKPSLPRLMEEICSILLRHPNDLKSITASYRLSATDTAYSLAFSLIAGHFALLTNEDTVDVSISGKEEDLLLVFHRKLSPMSALLRGKIKLQGSKSALLKLASFL